MTTASSTSQSGFSAAAGMRTTSPGPLTEEVGLRKMRGAASFGPPTSFAWSA